MGKRNQMFSKSFIYFLHYPIVLFVLRLENLKNLLSINVLKKKKNEKIKYTMVLDPGHRSKVT